MIDTTWLAGLYQHVDGGCISFLTRDKQPTFWQLDTPLQPTDNVLYHGCGVLCDRPASGRGTADDVVCLPYLWIDLDVAEGEHSRSDYPPVAVANKRLELLEHPPTYTVFTGGGYHLYWLLSEPVDPGQGKLLLTALLSKLRQVFEGYHVDKTTDLARMLRPVGSINPKYNYPVSLYDFNNVEYDINTILDWVGGATDAPLPPEPTGFDGAGGRNDRLKQVCASCIDRGLGADDTINALLEQDNTHTPPLFSDTSEAACRSRDTRINATAFYLGILRSVDSHREQRGEPTQEAYRVTTPVVESEDPFNLNLWSYKRYHPPAPQIEWLVKDVFPKAAPGLFCAEGGAGKGMYELDFALKVSDPDFNPHKHKHFGNQIVHGGKCVLYLAEDTLNDVWRRLEKLMPLKDDRYFDRLYVVPLPNAGGPLSMITKQRSEFAATDNFRRLTESLCKVEDLALVVMDPMASFFSVDINSDPAAAVAVGGLLGKLAVDTNATVLCAHHIRKSSGDKPIQTIEDARNSIRGTAAITDSVRAVYNMFSATPQLAKETCKLLHEKHKDRRVYFGGLSKNNQEGEPQLHTYVRDYERGVLEDRSDEMQMVKPTIDQRVDLLVDEITDAARTEPYTKYTVGTQIKQLQSPLCTMTRKQAYNLVEAAIEGGKIKETKVATNGRSKWVLVPAIE